MLRLIVTNSKNVVKSLLNQLKNYMKYENRKDYKESWETWVKQND